MSLVILSRVEEMAVAPLSPTLLLLRLFMKMKYDSNNNYYS